MVVIDHFHVFLQGRKKRNMSSVTEVCLCEFKVKYNSYHVQEVLWDFWWGSSLPLFALLTQMQS